MASVANKAILLGMLVALAIFNVGEPALTMVQSVSPQTTNVAIQLYGVAQEKLFCMVSACMECRIDCKGITPTPSHHHYHLQYCFRWKTRVRSLQSTMLTTPTPTGASSVGRPWPASAGSSMN